MRSFGIPPEIPQTPPPGGFDVVSDIPTMSDLGPGNLPGQGNDVPMWLGNEQVNDITAPEGRRPSGSGSDTPEASGAGSTPSDTDVPVRTDSSEAFPDVHVVDLEPLDAPDAMDAYEDFDDVFPEDVRERIAAAAMDVAIEAAPDIEEDDILVSGFETVPTEEGMAESDRHKLNTQSAVPKGGFLDDPDEGYHHFDGDDSNLRNITERNIQELRDEKRAIGKELALADEQHSLTASVRAEAAKRIQNINKQIAAKQLEQKKQHVPVYYATRLDGLRTDDPEDNPLAYVGDLPGQAHIAIYDRRGLVAAGIPISEKSDNQIRIAAFGAQIMRHCLGVLRFDIRD